VLCAHTDADSVYATLQSKLPEHTLLWSTMEVPAFVSTAAQHSLHERMPSARSCAGISDAEAACWLGPECATLVNLMMAHPKLRFFSINPTTGTARIETLDTNALLRRRYVLIQKAREAQTFGIVAGTLAATLFRPAIERIKELLRSEGKRFYTFVVGKLNVAKLANFQEIDCFVLVACEESTMIDAKAFYRPVVTPYELVLSCRREGDDWPASYQLQFEGFLASSAALLEEKRAEDASGDRDGEDEHVSYSFLSQRLRPANRAHDAPGSDANDGNNDGSDGTIAVRDAGVLAVSGPGSAAAFLAERSWRGLDPQLGQTPVAQVTQGRSGVARSYDTEPPRP
jgi:diphthamide biosynthesis protein 2